MALSYRIIFETYNTADSAEVSRSHTLCEDVITQPSSLLDLSMGLKKQIEILQKAQDYLLSEKLKVFSGKRTCSCCKGKLIKFGKHSSAFHDVLTDHKVTMQRLKCSDCNHEEPSTIRTAFNGIESAELIKIQAELGAIHSFRESEKIFEIFSSKRRKINNHDRIKNVVEKVGESLEGLANEEAEIFGVEPALELIVNVDGGHLKTTEDKRSIEAMTSVIYRPESLETPKESTRASIRSKNCAASALDDGQKQMINNTIIAALKQGLCARTKITALCDGAKNCWTIIDALEPLALSVERILDWFHITMKIKNIAVPESHKEKMEKVKWHLWHGNSDTAIIRLEELIELCSEKTSGKLIKFKAYIENNIHKIVNYNDRKEKKVPFTSNLAESTVESLINQRCKGHQHMRWSRKGLNPLLQLRAAISSKDWDNKWESAVLTALIN